MKPGDRARFFDALSGWRETGDVGDNDIYFKPATVERVYWQNSQLLVDIRFDHCPEVVRRGYFTNFTKPVSDD